MVKTDVKRKAWGFIVYPETITADEIVAHIESTHQPCIISPLHDSDMWTEKDEKGNPEHKAGTLKKPHFHGMWVFSGGARRSQALELCEGFGAACPKHVEPISSIVWMTRYFAHLDNPEKTPYNPSDIVAFNGARICLDQPSCGDDGTAILRAALDWLDKTGCMEYGGLVRHCMTSQPDWLPVVARRAVFFGHYLASVRGAVASRAVVRRG